MKNFLKQLFSFIFFMLRVVWAFLSYKAIYKRNELTSEKMYLEFYFRGRWYSPFYWLIQIIKTPFYILDAGLLSLLNEICYDLKNNGENIMTGKSGTFESGISETRRKYLRFIVTYSNLD